jgi:DNA-binding MarR family transcriptional regulator
VAFVDELQARGYVTRDRNDSDRRLYALHLTEQGRDLMTQLGDVAREHDRQITAGLIATQKTDLKRLLAQMAEHHDLTPGVHPGFRTAQAAGGRRAATRQRRA